MQRLGELRPVSADLEGESDLEESAILPTSVLSRMDTNRSTTLTFQPLVDKAIDSDDYYFQSHVRNSLRRLKGLIDPDEGEPFTTTAHLSDGKSKKGNRNNKLKKGTPKHGKNKLTEDSHSNLEVGQQEHDSLGNISNRNTNMREHTSQKAKSSDALIGSSLSTDGVQGPVCVKNEAYCSGEATTTMTTMTCSTVTDKDSMLDNSVPEASSAISIDGFGMLEDENSLDKFSNMKLSSEHQNSVLEISCTGAGAGAGASTSSTSYKPKIFINVDDMEVMGGPSHDINHDSDSPSKRSKGFGSTSPQKFRLPKLNGRANSLASRDTACGLVVAVGPVLPLLEGLGNGKKQSKHTKSSSLSPMSSRPYVSQPGASVRGSSSSPISPQPYVSQPGPSVRGNWIRTAHARKTSPIKASPREDSRAAKPIEGEAGGGGGAGCSIDLDLGLSSLRFREEMRSRSSSPTRCLSPASARRRNGDNHIA